MDGPKPTCLIQTFTGKLIDLMAIKPGDIRMADVAHALSVIPRWNGHTRRFYSVAQHSVHVSQLCCGEDKFWGLMHDAAEAYMCDLPRPIKHLYGMNGYCDLEKQVLMAIAEEVGLPPVMPARIHDADNVALATEYRDLFTVHHDLGLVLPDCSADRLKPLGSNEAKALFISTYEDLHGYLA